MTIFAMLGLAGSLFLTAGGVVAVTDGESPTVVALVGGASLAINILWLVLIFKTWRGRRWAWITVLVLEGLPALLVLAVAVAGLAGRDSSAVLGALFYGIPTLLVFLLLTLPRSSRDFFLRPFNLNRRLGERGSE